MYSIYADGELLYSPNAARRGYVLSNPTLTMEINKAGSLEFSLPYGSKGYNAYSRLKSIITVEQDGTEIWRGRVLDETIDTYLNKKVVCEGELAFLNDVLVRSNYYSGVGNLADLLYAIIHAYDTDCSDYRSIKPGEVYGANYSKSVDLTLEEPVSCWSEIVSKVVNPNGGYLKLRRENNQSYLDYYTEITEVSSQSIVFAENLIDIENYIDASSIYTLLIPYGKENENGDRINITSVNEGRDYITNPWGIDLYGVIQAVKIWDEVEDPSTLLSLAVEDLSTYVELAQSLTVSAFDLHLLDVDTEAFHVAEYIPVSFPKHGISDNIMLTQIEIDMENPDNSQFTLGREINSITDRQNATSSTANSTASAVSGLNNAIMGNMLNTFVTKADFNVSITNLQTDLEENYVTQTDFDALKQRVADLEGANA